MIYYKSCAGKRGESNGFIAVACLTATVFWNGVSVMLCCYNTCSVLAHAAMTLWALHISRYNYLCQFLASVQIQTKQHCDFRWWHAKAWKRCLARYWVDCNQSMHPRWYWLGSKWNAKFESHILSSMDWSHRTSFNFQFEDFLAICLCKYSSTVLLTNHP